jgi:transmembrane sensor
VALGTKVLSPGQVGERAVDGRVTVRSDLDLSPYFAWIDGRLVFEDTPLAEALPELERWYNLKFQLADSSLARLPLSGALDARPSAEMLDLLATLLDVRVDRRGDTVVLERVHR